LDNSLEKWNQLYFSSYLSKAEEISLKEMISDLQYSTIFADGCLLSLGFEASRKFTEESVAIRDLLMKKALTSRLEPQQAEDTIKGLILLVNHLENIGEYSQKDVTTIQVCHFDCRFTLQDAQFAIHL
jgi:hypothetical protein